MLHPLFAARFWIYRAANIMTFAEARSRDLADSRAAEKRRSDQQQQ
jgi:hypothetical protein